MTQLPLFQPEPLPAMTVAELTRYLSALLERDPVLQDVWVTGEVSNFSRPASGHLYFTLKDARASLRCVMWRAAAARLRFLPQDGAKVEVHGKLGIYDQGGQYQLYVDVIRLGGEGALYQQFMRLKAQLEAEGLFDAERKRPLPAWPRRIGIVTSPTGAALQDMLNTLRRRFPLAEVIVAPTPVQGDEAPAGIVRALQTLARRAAPDVVLVARGGGSIEDLWAFNDERVARAIAAAPFPVITGIGHETDFTIADFAADLRAPTPTAAAELATPDQLELRQKLAGLTQYLERVAAAGLAARRWALADMQARLRQYTPQVRIRSDRQRLDELARRGERALSQRLRLQQAHLTGLTRRLAALNPHGILARGYALITTPEGEVVRRVAQAVPGQAFDVRVSDGTFQAEVRPRS